MTATEEITETPTEALMPLTVEETAKQCDGFQVWLDIISCRHWDGGISDCRSHILFLWIGKEIEGAIKAAKEAAKNTYNKDYATKFEVTIIGTTKIGASIILKSFPAI